MRQETAGVTEALLESAKKEFLKYGFHDANLRRISADSGVSTNSIYTRFGDKSGLFSAVVKPAADGLMEIYLGSISEASVCGSANTAIDMGGDGTEQVLKYIYDNLYGVRGLFRPARRNRGEVLPGFRQEIREGAAENKRFLHTRCLPDGLAVRVRGGLPRYPIRGGAGLHEEHSRVQLRRLEARHGMT